VKSPILLYSRFPSTTKWSNRKTNPKCETNLPQENVNQNCGSPRCLLQIIALRQLHCATLPRMRPLLQYRTPAQLLWIIGAMNVLVSLSFGLLGVGSCHYPHRHLPFPLALFSFGALVLGLIGTLIAESNLKNGIRSERWPDAQLDALRKVVAHPAFFMLPFLLIIASFVYIISSRSGPLSGGWMFLYPAMSLTRVISALRPRQADADHRSRMDPPKPLRSEHWGSPRQPFSN
jgi:hypothetical protein